jgi:RND superfamily putative drug exporter
VLCIALLGFGAYQAKNIRLGLNLVEGLPETSEARLASDAASKGFATGILSPTEVLLKAPASPTDART